MNNVYTKNANENTPIVVPIFELNNLIVSNFTFPYVIFYAPK